MSRTLTQKESYNTLKTTFKNKFGVDPGRDAYSKYSKKYFVYVTDPRGNSYYLDEKTNQKVTASYRNKLKSRLQKSSLAINDIGKPIQLSQLKADLDVFDKAHDLSIKKDRARFSTRAKEGDPPPKGDTPRKVLNSQGELVIKGGKQQYLKNQIVNKAEEKLRIAEEKANSININKHANALKVMGITSRTWQNPYYGDQRDYEAGGVYEGQDMPKKTPQVIPAKAPTTGEVLVNKAVLEESKNKQDKAPAPPVVQATLKSDVFTLDKDGKMLGVMTRSQRRNWDAANQSLMIERQKDLKIADRSYYNRGELLRIGSG